MQGFTSYREIVSERVRITEMQQLGILEKEHNKDWDYLVNILEQINIRATHSFLKAIIRLDENLPQVSAVRYDIPAASSPSRTWSEAPIIF